jgi:mRNA-degrading endonuclease RelE of RelBE toxin-antitoxin system
MENAVAATDKFRRATFEGFKIIRGPIGKYRLFFVTGDPKSTVNITTSSFSTYIDTNVK